MLRRQLKSTAPEDDLDSVGEIDSLASWIRWAINIIAGILVAFFTWLQFRSIEISSLINATKPDVLLKFTLVVYYFCWIFGSSFDLKIQQSTFVRDPNRGRLPKAAIGILFVFGIATVVLVWTSDNEARFAAALTFFWITGTSGFAYLLHVIKPIVGASGRLFSERQDYYRLERLLLVARYMCGNWQWYRIALSCLLVILIDIISWSHVSREVVGNFIHTLAPAVRIDTMLQLLPSLSFFTFVLVTELWIWVNRLRIYTSLKMLDDLKRRYLLELKNGVRTNPNSRRIG